MLFTIRSNNFVILSDNFVILSDSEGSVPLPPISQPTPILLTQISRCLLRRHDKKGRHDKKMFGITA